MDDDKGGKCILHNLASFQSTEYGLHSSSFLIIGVKFLSLRLTRIGVLSMQLSAWCCSGCLVCGSEQYDDIIMRCTILEMLH